MNLANKIQISQKSANWVFTRISAFIMLKSTGACIERCYISHSLIPWNSGHTNSRLVVRSFAHRLLIPILVDCIQINSNVFVRIFNIWRIFAKVFPEALYIQKEDWSKQKFFGAAKTFIDCDTKTYAIPQWIVAPNMCQSHAVEIVFTIIWMFGTESRNKQQTCNPTHIIDLFLSHCREFSKIILTNHTEE